MEDFRQQITDDIIACIEREGGVPPWRKSWTSACLHFNASSGVPYTGINQLILSIKGHEFGDARWLTYKQAQYMGLNVRKGERGTRVVKVVERQRKKEKQVQEQSDDDALAHDDSSIFVLKVYTVFNAKQIDGMAPMPERECDVQPAEAVEAIVWGLQDTGLKLNFGGNQPCYRPRSDEISCPVASNFQSIEDFHASLLHECAHASGHPKRLARLHFDVQRGSPEYAREELRAELASAMMAAMVGLPPGPSMIESHASYVSSWLDVLRSDKAEIFRAAADAQKICDYLSDRALEVQHQFDPAPVEQAESPAPVISRVARMSP